MSPEYPYHNASPFQEELDTNVFFPEAGRETTLQSIILDILEGKRLIKLSGREGSGKTLICRLIITQLPAEYEVLYIDNPVGAFDNLLRSACIDLGMDPDIHHDGARYQDALHHLLLRKQQENKKFVLIIDEAEKLFMATLERLVRQPGGIPQDMPLTLLLVGRLALDGNLDKLSTLCDQINLQSSYKLDELTENETRRYLAFRLQAAGRKLEEYESILADGALAKIYETARGNIRLSNILAEETLQAAQANRSFMVLLDHVDAAPKVRKPSSRTRRMAYLALGGGLLLIFLALILYLPGRNQPVLSPADKPELQQPEVPADSAPDAGDASSSQPAKPPGEQPSTAKPAESITGNEAGDGDAPTAPHNTGIEPAEPTEPVGQTAPLTTEQKPQPVPEAENPPETQKPQDTALEQPNVTEPSSAETTPTPPEEMGYGAYEPLTTSEQQATPLSVTSLRVTPAAIKEPPLGWRESAVAEASAQTDRTRGVSPVFQERQKAGDAWLTGRFNQEYTVQLMLLTSEQAAERISQLLAQQNYAPLQSKIYILKKEGPITGFFLFYGKYDSMEAARAARNAMPSFLLQLQPYPLSIGKALDKINVEP